MMVVSLVQWKISYIDYNIKDIKIKLLDLLKMVLGLLLQIK